MKKFIILSASMLALAACSQADKTAEAPVSTPISEAPADINERLDVWFEEKFMESARRYPQALAQLGIRERMDEWNDPSRAYALEELDITRQNLEELKANFDFDALDADHQLSYRLYVKTAEQSLEGQRWWNHGYPFNQMFGAHAGTVSFLINQHPIKSEEDARNYIARLNGMNAYMQGVLENARRSAEMGIQPPRFVYDYVINASQNVVTGAPFDDGDYSTLLKDFNKKIEALELDDETRESLYSDAITALMTSVGPAYEAVIAEMEDQKALSTTDDGAWKLPEGEGFYSYRLNLMTTTDLSADEIHDIGLAEMDRIHGEMRAIMAKVGYEGTLQEFFEFLRTDPQFYYEDSDAGRDAYLKDAAALIDIMKGRLDEVFLRKPVADIEVKRVEAFREKGAGKAFYNRPSEDGSRPGYYYANLYKITDMPIYQMEALAYHEGIPGHHMQLAIAQELKGVPKFRKYGRYTAYTEGWGLYSEYLPKEMGFYSDPYSDFGRLAMELWRAARLVVDTGLHHKKWTREQAIDYLVTNTPNPENDCQKAIERYIVMPGQATAYKIGMLKILELREEAKEAMGEAFDIREFHDIIIASGPVPLDIMEERIKAWATSKR